MPGMMPNAGDALDQRRDPGQRPQIGAEALGPRARPQRTLDQRQLLALEPRLAPGPARGFEPGPPIRLPRLMPMIHRCRRHAQDPRHRRLRLATREQLCGAEPSSFQRSKIPWGPAAGGEHGSA